MTHLRWAIAAMLATGPVLSAQEWTGWRGPSRDGTVAAAMVPKPWPKSLTRSWQVEVGEGYSSPVVSRGRAFVHSRRDPDEIVTAIDVATGKVAWQQHYPAAFQKNQYAAQMAKGPNSTPLVAGTRLYTLGVTGVLTAWNTADGAVIWRGDYSASVDTSKLFCGTAMSPMLDGGLSAKRRGQFVILDAATGALKSATEGRDGNHASILIAPEHVLLLTDGGALIIAPRGSDTFVEERRYEIGKSATWTLPVLLPDGMLVREASGVVRLTWS